MDTILFSQIGYDSGMSKKALIKTSEDTFINKTARYKLLRTYDKKLMHVGSINYWGEKWGFHWYLVDFSDFNLCGAYTLWIQQDGDTILSTCEKTPIKIGKDLLWHETWYKTTLYHLNIRSAHSYQPEGGWKDCGSTLQEVSSHVIMINGLCDLLESCEHRLSKDDKNKILDNIKIGCDYIIACQDKANELDIGNGAVVHEIRKNHKVITGNVAKTAMILARSSRLILDDLISEKYLYAAEKAYSWIEKNGPLVYHEDSDSYAIVHGAPYTMNIPPMEWLTRDLVMMCWASVELYKNGKVDYQEKAVQYAEKIIKRQVPKEKNEDGFFGHFYTYDSYDITEKADIHCGAWDLPYKNYNQGGHFPHYILPLSEMVKLWGEHEQKECWVNALHNFAYGYFLPSIEQSPFSILPAGYYEEQGLLYFSGWYHGHNKIYGYAASLAMEFKRIFEDPLFEDIAVSNLQWIAGLNVGKEIKGVCQPVSMIVGVGNLYECDWNNMEGTIINGWDASKQFTLEYPDSTTDLPNFCDDEGAIHHCAGWISGLSKLYSLM